MQTIIVVWWGFALPMPIGRNNDRASRDRVVFDVQALLFHIVDGGDPMEAPTRYDISR